MSAGTYVYPVTPQDGTHMNLIGAYGDCLLALTTESEIICALAGTRQVVGVWPFNCLRRYWCGEGVVGFEAGKRSPRGEGTFTFATTQDEEVYMMLKKYIERAKQASLRRGGSQYRGMDLVGGDVNSRPKLPLPHDSAQAELANGDEYAQIPAQDVLVGQPSSKSPLQRANSLPHHTEVSTTTPPVYGMKRAQTTRPKRIQQWVEQTEAAISREREVGVAMGGTDAPPPPVTPRGRTRGSPTLAEEDMYSHTQHVMPAPFQRHATVHAIVEESTYNTLVHGKCPATLKRRATEGAGATGEGLYSIAYPPGTAGMRRICVAAAPGEEYGTLGRDTVDSSLRGAVSEQATPPVGAEEGGKPAGEGERTTSASAAVQDLVSPGFEDSMTENLLYNTRIDVLTGSQPGLAGVKDHTEKEEEMETVEVTEQSMLLSGRPEVGVVSEEANGESGNRGEDEEDGGGEREGVPSSEIQRDAKGYSKVNKAKKREENVVGSPDDPPPLPPRLYEGAEEEEEEMDQQQMSQDPSPLSLVPGTDATPSPVVVGDA